MVKFRPTELSHPDKSVASALLGLFPFIFMAAVTYTWLRLWPDLVTKHLFMFILSLGLLFGHQVGLMITSHVAKLDFPYWNSSVNLTLVGGCAFAYLDVER